MNAFEQGQKDFHRGQLSNPYTRDTPKHRDWEFGFNKAYFRNLDKIEARGRGAGVSSKEKV